MKIFRAVVVSAVAAAAALLHSAFIRGDEGMWLFNNPPIEELQQRYGFRPTPEWLGHLQRSSVRFNNGGSGSFVSPDGLAMTNHHVGADALQKFSTKEKDYLTVGFHAGAREEELRCPDLELNVLVGIEDVTSRVNGAVRPGSSSTQAEKARRAVMNTIEKEAADATGLRCDVVTLYQGGMYHLYRYKKYTDVRLVFAPEHAIAAFGGDPDNFEFPRYDLDICFFRAYENGKPARTADYLTWDSRGVAEGDLVFVSGHPGRTERLNTLAHLEYLRDCALPFGLNKLRRMEVLLETFSRRSLESARRAQGALLGVQNGRKAGLGRLAGLQDPGVMGRKTAEEQSFRQGVAKDPRLQADYGTAWDDVAATLKTLREIYVPLDLLERGSAFHSKLFGIARTLVRLNEETAKPNADRLREYRESNLDYLKLSLFSPAPIYSDLETAELADSLSMFMELAGANDPLVRDVLAGRSPPERAAELIAGTKVGDVAVRKQLAEGGLAALKATADPMIQLALKVDAPARRLRSTFEQQVEEQQRQAYARISHARFAIQGTSMYPDATFTLRLSFGTIKGYDQQNRKVPPWTTIGGAFHHAVEHGHHEPFNLPERWTRRQQALDPGTPLNFVATTDIVGGNSGSPVVNRDGAITGIIFDGNIESLVWDFVYTDQQARAVAVDCRGILEALRKVYDAGPLVEELTQPK